MYSSTQFYTGYKILRTKLFDKWITNEIKSRILKMIQFCYWKIMEFLMKNRVKYFNSFFIISNPGFNLSYTKMISMKSSTNDVSLTRFGDTFVNGDRNSTKSPINSFGFQIEKKNRSNKKMNDQFKNHSRFQSGTTSLKVTNGRNCRNITFKDSIRCLFIY
jgi:hypothetical protein